MRYKLFAVTIFFAVVYAALRIKDFGATQTWDADEASKALSALYGIILTTQSLLFVIAAGNHQRWPGLGRILGFSWYYLALSFAAVATFFTFLSHYLENDFFLMSGTMLWAVTVLFAGFSLVKLLRLNTRDGRVAQLRKVLLVALKEVSTKTQWHLLERQNQTFSDFFSALENSLSKSDGGDLLDLIKQAKFCKKKPEAYPAYLAFEARLVRQICASMVEGKLSVYIGETALRMLTVDTKSPRSQIHGVEVKLSYELLNLALTIRYLNWFEYALLVEQEFGLLNIPKLRKIFRLIEVIRADISSEVRLSGDKSYSERHVNPAEAIESPAESFLYYKFSGDYGTSSFSYSHYVLYETITGTRFGGNYFVGKRPILEELCGRVFQGASLPENVEITTQSAPLLEETKKLFGDSEQNEENFRNALREVHVHKLASLYSRLKLEKSANLTRDLITSFSRLQSVFTAVSSLQGLESPESAMLELARLLNPAQTDWGRAKAVTLEISSKIYPMPEVPLKERLATVLIVVASSLYRTVGPQGKEKVEEFLNSVPQGLFKDAEEILETFTNVGQKESSKEADSNAFIDSLGVLINV